jgi:signal transduction histidine kinase
VLKLNSELEFRVNERTAQLAESQYLYSAIARNYPNGTINVFDKHFDYIFTEGKELFKMGITSEHLIGTNYLDRLSGEVKDEITTYLESALKGVNDELEIELRGEHYLLNFVGLKGNDEKIDKILVVEQNISRQKQAEKEIMQALQQEKDLNELKSRFVSTASHEFRTPLSTILSSASILERYLKAEEMDPAEVEARQIKHLKKISTSVTNLTNILNDFLSIDKLESGLKSNATVFNLSELMEEIIEEIKEVLKPSQEIIFSNDCDAEITQDRNIIKNIVINLLSNASKYSDPGARIDLITACNNRSVQVSVVDQGMGIPEEEHKHLFTRFFRASNATNHGGTGLGLHIVKKYTEMLSGNIHFTSEQGKGSRFVVSLPKSARP